MLAVLSRLGGTRQLGVAVVGSQWGGDLSRLGGTCAPCTLCGRVLGCRGCQAFLSRLGGTRQPAVGVGLALVLPLVLRGWGGGLSRLGGPCGRCIPCGKASGWVLGGLLVVVEWRWVVGFRYGGGGSMQLSAVVRLNAVGVASGCWWVQLGRCCCCWLGWLMVRWWTMGRVLNQSGAGFLGEVALCCGLLGWCRWLWDWLGVRWLVLWRLCTLGRW